MQRKFNGNHQNKIYESKREIHAILRLHSQIGMGSRNRVVWTQTLGENDRKGRWVISNNETKGSIWKQQHLLALVLLTVLTSVFLGGCVKQKVPEIQTLVIRNPEISLEGFTIYKPEERVSDPRAQEAEYVYLVIDSHVVELTGPWISSEDGVDIISLFELGNERVEIINSQEGWADGFKVTVNPHLIYSISIDDFEYEVGLAQVELIKEEDTIESQFIFPAIGDGVAHDLMITAVVDGDSIRSTIPITIEAREGTK